MLNGRVQLYRHGLPGVEGKLKLICLFLTFVRKNKFPIALRNFARDYTEMHVNDLHIYTDASKTIQSAA